MIDEDSELMSWLLYSSDAIDMDAFTEALPPSSLGFSPPITTKDIKKEMNGNGDQHFAYKKNTKNSSSDAMSDNHSDFHSDMHSENEHLHSDLSSDEHEHHSSGSHKDLALQARKKRQRDDALEKRLDELQTGI